MSNSHFRMALPARQIFRQFEGQPTLLREDLERQSIHPDGNLKVDSFVRRDTQDTVIEPAFENLLKSHLHLVTGPQRHQQ